MKRRMIALFLALCVAAAGLALLVAVSVAPPQGLTSFRSYSELTAYLDRVQGRGYAYFRDGSGGLLTGPAAPGAGGDYSGTNVQVAGIDELDTVKTDGSYLYLAGDRDVAIVRAVPASDLAVVARIPSAVGANASVDVSAARVTGLFVVNQKLIVVASSGYSYPIDYVRGAPSSTVVGAPVLIAPWGGTGGDTLVSVYGVEDPAHPSLLRTYQISGSPMTGRLIPPFVYLVINQPDRKSTRLNSSH